MNRQIWWEFASPCICSLRDQRKARATTGAFATPPSAESVACVTPIDPANASFAVLRVSSVEFPPRVVHQPEQIVTCLAKKFGRFFFCVDSRTFPFQSIFCEY